MTETSRTGVGGQLHICRKPTATSDGDVPQNDRPPSKTACFDGDVPFFCRSPSPARRIPGRRWHAGGDSGPQNGLLGRKWQKGGILLAGPLFGVSFQAPLAAKRGFFVVRGAARDTPNDGRIRYDGDSRNGLCHDGSEKSNRKAEKAEEQGPGGISSDSGPLFRSVGAKHSQSRTLLQSVGARPQALTPAFCVGA